MARLTRHQLRTDELESRLTAISAFFVVNRKNIVLGSAAALLVIAVIVGAIFYVRGRQGQASEAFSKALEAFHAPVTPVAPAGYVGPTFPTDEAKYTAALQQFQDVAGQYSRYAPGPLARYYAALCLDELGKQAEAEKEFSAIAQQQSGDVAALAKMALANIYQQTDRAAEAEKYYRELESNPTASVPKVAAQFALADLIGASNPPQALEIYKQIVQENPDTSAADLAKQRMDALAQ
ncbi:MAG: hypothetical protein A3H27_11255 [Acidobacteria bacterium RIFCSPLOWO2_02_FULL_59_13]|nr:MAG: hypothetical protein A3H27_11255 [Acidobacteria bacterium RIFCSPLOWO2_02_FULL_59_13]